MTEGRSTEVVRIDALVCGPEFLSLLDEPRVIALAKRMAARGADVATPIVRARDMAVIAGEDVIAALCRLDIDELRVELVHDGSFDDEPGTELSPDVETRYAGGAVAAVAERTDVTPAPVVLCEFDSMEVVMDHRHGVLSVSASSGGQRATLERARAAAAEGERLTAEADAAEADYRSGQRATMERVAAVQAQVGTQKAAVAAVAAETGRSEHAVKKAANRAKRAKDKVSIETWGRPQPEAWMASTAELRRALTNASNSIRTALSALSPLMGIAVPGADPAVAYEELKERASKLRDARPACVCAWCKNEPTLVARCVACGGRGWLGEKAMGLVPKELFPPGSAMAQGRPVELEPVPVVSGAHRDGTAYDSPVPDQEWPEAGAYLVAAPCYGADAEPLESRSHTVEPVSTEQAEAAWSELEEAEAAFADCIECVGGDEESEPEDGGLW